MREYLLARRLLHEKGGTYLYVASTGKEALRFQEEVSFFLGPYAAGESFFFPPPDALPFSNLSPHNDIRCDRLKVLHALNRPTPPLLICTTGPALLSYLPPRDFFKPIMLKTGQELSRELFLKDLVVFGYQNVPWVIDRGNFAVRGGIVDLFTPQSDSPCRIEWMGDTIESIRTFDPKTQRSQDPQESMDVIPVREILLNEKTMALFSQKIRQSAEGQDLMRSDWFPWVEKVREKIYFSGIETYLPFFYEHPTTLQDWLPTDTKVIVESNVQKTLQDYRDEIGSLVQGKKTIITQDQVMVPAQKIKNLFEDQASFPDLSFETHEMIRHEIEAARKTLEPLAPLARRLQEWLMTDSVHFVVSSHTQAERLADLLSRYIEKSIPIMSPDEARPLQSIERGTIRLWIGELSSGFRIPSEGITFVTEGEIFGEKLRKARERATASDFSSFAEIKQGDPLVHKEHGIGIYQGLVNMEINGCKNDFLLITFYGGDKLYLPVYRMNLIQRYTGSDKAPRLDKMGGTNWSKVKAKAEKVIHELAGDLLNLYAARQKGKGFAFSPPDDLFEAFEAGFPYEETPDQEQAIRDVLEDMQKDEPMDRLVLGDVGYGKTEVALRAAYKAALDGKQVACLVPTTLLAFQHYDRFVERFKDTPLKVEMLSRFRSPVEQKKILKETAEGKIDILIGTHRLLQSDISFKDLGLLIIDEEHRFGVEHKEKMKRLKKDVDVLALSATPIPRTLHMSMVGIRKMSLIETPPNDRLSIRTFVMPLEDKVVREAILREIKRGGQVFFVHNEIKTIGKMREYLMTLVPEAKIEIGHGQMEEDGLEKVMIRFFHREFDVLLCTTIIESGIDIPTANTIMINEADHFGLAQIYQLRGRVGRGSHRAYAYLLVDEEKNLTPEATQRLSVLKRFSELGSGYKMAAYDLEIRGAGNLLGTEQAGQITAIGYELYTELLEKAVRELKGEKFLQEIDPELHFPISSYLPEDYIPDPPVRLELYRRLASLDNEDEIDPIDEELRDRFGTPPTEVENLMELSVIKAFAKKLRIKEIRYDGRNFTYAFDPSSPLPPHLLTDRIKKEPKRYRLTPDFKFTVIKESMKPVIALAEAKKFLRELLLHLA
ncbi:MAG: transcription-repair coupling factor [Deltaproteobacteria bacterium]|nr:transcription-repair coupling factor [Deltaproteobacteria bacterium]